MNYQVEANRFLKSRRNDKELIDFIKKMKLTNASQEWKEQRMTEFLIKNYSNIIPDNTIVKIAHYCLL